MQRSSGREVRLVRHFDQQRRLQAVAARQQPIVQIELPLYSGGLRQAGNPQQLLDAEPERLPVFKKQGCPRTNANAAVAVEIAPQRFEELAAAAGVLFEGKQIIQRERTHETARPWVSGRRHVPKMAKMSRKVKTSSIVGRVGC